MTLLVLTSLAHEPECCQMSPLYGPHAVPGCGKRFRTTLGDITRTSQSNAPPQLVAGSGVTVIEMRR